MTEERARELLSEWIREDDTLLFYGPYVSWVPTRPIVLDGEFTADELEALAWWMRNIVRKTS